jgi:hypothetical protein
VKYVPRTKRGFGTFESLDEAKKGVDFYKMIGEKPTRRGKKVYV